jgi:hypothetical protein
MQKKENVVTEKRGCTHNHSSLSSNKVNNSSDDCRKDDPEQLEPVEKGNVEKLWVHMVVKRWPKQHDERDDQQKQKPAAVLV